MIKSHLIFSLFLILSAPTNQELPDYKDPKQASLSFTEVCEDGSTTRFFIQNAAKNYYLLYETTAKNSEVYFRITWIVEENKIDKVEHFVRTDSGLVSTGQAEWEKKLKSAAPEHLLYTLGQGNKCKILTNR